MGCQANGQVEGYLSNFDGGNSTVLKLSGFQKLIVAILSSLKPISLAAALEIYKVIQSNTLIEMDTADNLLESLMHWSMKISQTRLPQPWQQNTFYRAMSSVLNQIDADFFGSLLQGEPTLKDLVGLSSKFSKVHLSSELPAQLLQLDDKFITDETLLMLFEMVYGMALKIDKQRYLMYVLELEEKDREVLMPFINHLVRGQRQVAEEEPELEPEFMEPEPTSRHQQMNKLLEELEMKEVECKVYKEKIEELEQKNKELEYNYESMKDDNTRINDELSHTRSEKHELMIELGIRSSQAGYGEIVVRYREMLSSYQTKIDDLEQALERTSNQIEEKNNELDVLRKNYGSLNTLPSEQNISTEQFQKMESVYQSKLQDCQRTIQNLTGTLNDRNELIKQLSQKRQQLQIQNTQLKNSALKAEQSLERYRQLKKLTKGFFRQVQNQFKV